MRPGQVDGPWAWVVVVAAFIVHVISHGIVYSFGLLFLALEERFPEATTSDIAWIPSITVGTMYFSGPVGSFLINRYGCRIVTVVGAIFGAVGFGVSGFVHNIILMYLTLGLLAGFGLGLVFLCAIIIVTLYFDKYRSLACSLALTGAGGGAFIFSPLIAKLLKTYNPLGTFLILSSIILNCIPCGLLFMPVQKNAPKQPKCTDITLDPCDDKLNENLIDNHDEKYPNERNSPTTSSTGHRTSMDPTKSEHIGGLQIENEVSDLIHGKHVEIAFYKDVSNCDEHSNLKVRHSDSGKEHTIAGHLYMLKYRVTLMFFASQFLFFFGFYLPFIYIPDKAIKEGIEEAKVAWVASTIGLSSIAGRVILGYVADLPSVNRTLLFKLSVFIAGVSTLFGPLLGAFELLICYAVVFGAFTGISLSLTSVVLVDFVGVELVSDAIGMNNLFSGLGCLIGPPFAGFLFDSTGSYDVVFIVPGSAIVSSAIIVIVTPYCSKQL